MKKLLILAGVIAITTSAQVLADESVCPVGSCPVNGQTQEDMYKCPDEMHKTPQADMKKLEEKLKLTDSQKAELKKIRAKEAEAIKPVEEKIKVKHEEAKAILDEKLTAHERQEKLAPIHKEIGSMKKEIHKIHEQSRQDFEAILTSKQLKKLKKLKSEAKQEWENHENGQMHKRPPMAPECGCECGCGRPHIMPQEPPCQKDDTVSPETTSAPAEETTAPAEAE